MHAGRVRNAAHDTQGIDVDYFDLRSVRDVQTTGRFVDREVIPAAVAGDGNPLGD